ncbi:MAG: hypothetical protein LUQ65_05880, partial [Candidatus Helarchaeota archaeon]|nr:hypothetical protein [Candidatus Helarchaeota archaeon]
MEFSIDGPPEINDIFRSKGKIILDNISRLHKKGIDFGTLIVLDQENGKRIRDVLSFFLENGINSLGINTLVPVGSRGKRNSLPDPD